MKLSSKGIPEINTFEDLVEFTKDFSKEGVLKLLWWYIKK